MVGRVGGSEVNFILANPDFEKKWTGLTGTNAHVYDPDSIRKGATV